MRAAVDTKWARLALVAVLFLFGFLTLFLSTAVLLDLFDVREMEGNYVPFVVLANFIASNGYIAAAIGLLAHRTWAHYPLWMAGVVLLMASVALGWHVYHGGLHEAHTIRALIFRTLLTITLYAMAAWLNRARAHKPHSTTERP